MPATLLASLRRSGWGHLLATAALALTTACSSGGGPSGSGGGGAGGGGAVLDGRWALVFSGLPLDFPNAAPRLDLHGGEAHLVYASKTTDLKYFVFDRAGASREIVFPQGTKNVSHGVSTLPDGDSLVVVQDTFNGQLGALRASGGATSPFAAPGASIGGVSVRWAVTSAADGAVFVGAGADGTLTVERSSAAGWDTLGSVAVTGTLSRLRLATDGASFAFAALTGVDERDVWRWDNGAITALGGPPAAGSVGILSLLVDGSNVFFLEFEEAIQRSVLWVHDGASWSEWARSEEGECFHGLTMHGGGLYTLTASSPDTQRKTFGWARLDRGAVTRRAADTQSATPNIDPDSRFDAMEYEESALLSRDGDLYMTYQESPAGESTIRLYRWEAR